MGDGNVRPLIAVTTSEVRQGAGTVKQGEPPQVEMVLGLAYLQAVEAAGGIPLVAPPMRTIAIEPLLDQVAGVCLSGGPDLDPDAYGADRHAALGPVDAQLDRFELELARAADERGLPVLAICRGMQALNVARGGSLHQHLPDRAGVEADHRQTRPGTEPTHEVSVAEGSQLHRLMGVTEARVNSFHHQAVDRLGQGLRAVSWSRDGVIEGVEAPGRPFEVGVQWHAETLTAMPEHEALFAGLVEAAALAQARRPAWVA